ncbi:MAG: aminoacyl-tRNA hydrolase [Bacteroidetes bacterium]|nr:aminoacyl-tRNA hydrolase [Bacteroidota bacterium]
MDTAAINKLLEQIHDFELTFAATRSGGPGGQHANKVSTKVEVRFNIPSSDILSPEQKATLLHKLAPKLTTDGELIVTSQATRSQADNKEQAIEKCLALLRRALTPAKKRKRTKPSPAARAKRLEEKKKQAQKKEQRRPPDL